jgi:hypothetical protein
MDADRQINAGIPQVHLEGVHGLRQDGMIDHEKTTTFIVMKKGAHTGFLGAGKTNRDITPTVIEFVLPNSKVLLAGLDGAANLLLPQQLRIRDIMLTLD